MAPDDAPQGYQDVARTLQAAALMASDAPTQGAATAVAAFLDAIPSRRTTRMKKWKIAAAALAGGLTLSTGLAAADVLPGPAQDVASSALSHVGFNVPDGDDGSSHVTTVKDKQQQHVEDDATPAGETEHPDNHGSVVSKVAQDDSNVGADHGAAVCTAASEGKCQAGDEHGKPATDSANKGQGSVNSTEGSANSTEGSANSGEDHSGATSSNGTSSSSSSSSGSSNSSSGSSGSSSSGSGG
jgi:uncharacterized membrane protein YgcG